MASTPLPTTSADAPQLDLLAPELVDHIFSFLIPPMPEIGETRPVGGYDKLLPEEPWYEPTRCRAALRASCLVSKRIRAAAEPHQYHSVALLSDRQFICFLRTLATRHGDIAQWNRYFAVHLTLNDIDVYTPITQSFRALPASTWSASTNDTIKSIALFRREKGKGDSEWLRAVPECLLMAMLTVLNKTEIFLLQIPVSELDDQPQYSTLLETFHHTQNKSMGKSLRSLLIQTDPEVLSIIHDDVEAHGEPGITASSAGVYWPILLHCPNVTTLEASYDDGNWCTSAQLPSSFCLTGGCPGKLPRLRHVYLNDSYSKPQTVADLLAHMPMLETLYVDPRWSEDNMAQIETQVTRTLDGSLLAYGQNLRRLDLGFLDCQGATPSIGEDGYLTCLPRLPKLEQLHIQLGLLFPSAPETASLWSDISPNNSAFPPPASIPPTAPFPNLSQRLPPNVTELALEDWWWRPPPPLPDSRFRPDGVIGDQDFRIFEYYRSAPNASHRRAIVAGLLRFATEACGGAMPKLRKVVFLVRTSEQWTFPGQHYNVRRPCTVPTLMPEERNTLAEVERRTPPPAWWDEKTRWEYLEHMLRIRSAIEKKFAAVKGLMMEVNNHSGLQASDRLRRQANTEAEQSVMTRLAEAINDCIQLFVEPMTLREHLAEVEAMFLRHGIEFEVSEM